MKRVRRAAAATAAALVLVGLSALPAAAEPPEVPSDVGELVGAAFNPGSDVLWLAGAGADDGTLVGLDAEGARSEITFGGDPVSVQGLAIHEGRIYIGDIGDPDAERDHIVVFRLAEAEAGRQPYNAYDFSFPGGARNATALLVSGRGRIYIVTDGDDPGIYGSSLEPSRSQVNRLTRMADAPEGVTDGVFLEDGSTMALRTAEGIEVIDAFSWETRATETLVGAPADEVIAALPGAELLVGSAAGLRQSMVPQRDTTTKVEPPAPEPDASPSPTADSSPTGGATETPDVAAPDGEEADSAPARTGTLVAVLAALVVAVGAGLSTLLVRE